MEKDYSYSAFKWLTYPLFYILFLILTALITFVTVRIPALSKVTDLIFLVYLLTIMFLPVVFALCSIPGFMLSFKALRNQEPKHKILGNLMISGIYLSAGFYCTYHFTYQTIISMI